MNTRKAALGFIFITLFLDIFGIGLIIPILPRLVEELQGGDVAAASLSVGWLASLLLTPFGDPALRMNLLSALLVAGAAAGTGPSRGWPAAPWATRIWPPASCRCCCCPG